MVTGCHCLLLPTSVLPRFPSREGDCSCGQGKQRRQRCPAVQSSHAEQELGLPATPETRAAQSGLTRVSGEEHRALEDESPGTSQVSPRGRKGSLERGEKKVWAGRGGFRRGRATMAASLSSPPACILRQIRCMDQPHVRLIWHPLSRKQEGRSCWPPLGNGRSGSSSK